MRKLIVLRRVSQISFLALFVYVLWSTTYPLKGIFSPQILFKLDPLIMFLASVSERLLLPGLIFSFILVGLTLIVGRFFCGWVCPLGTLLDWAGVFNRQKKTGLTSSQRQILRRPKFFLFGSMTLLALAGIQTAWVFDPIVTVARVVSLNVIPALTLATDKTFQFLIQKFELYGGVYDFYRTLKAGLLGINVHFFANSLSTFLFFLCLCLASAFILRLWCRMLCPLGALYALNARSALLSRKVKGCSSCGQCVVTCRMGAIENGADYHKGECILCMDCVYVCPSQTTEFSWGKGTKPDEIVKNEKGITRAQFLFLLGSLIPLLGFKSRGQSLVGQKNLAGPPVIRPPGVLSEGKFIDTCVRCGNCMKVCITNGLQPVSLESGLEGLWTPRLVPEIGYCEYNCTLCGEVCPTQAIPKLSVEAKRQARLGLAQIDHSICLAWDGNEECIVCEEHCPVSEKAIKVREEIVNGKKIFRPSVDEELCIGCGICQNKCPVRPLRAIRVNPNEKKGPHA